LKNDFGIEFKSVREHFAWRKIIEKMIDYQPLIKEIPFIPSREPPRRWVNNLSKIVNY
jgi:hypothetical protein